MDLITLNSLIGKTLIPMTENMSLSYVTAVVITGLSVVFLSLIILIIFVSAYGKFFSRKNAKPVKVNTETVPKPVAAVAVKPQTDDNQDEVVAVIAAAVAAMGASEGKTYRMKSVRAINNKPSRSAWSMAGIQNDTTPF